MSFISSYYQSYPVFRDSVILYEYKDFGVISFTQNGNRIKTDNDIFSFLKNCNGKNSIKEILEGDVSTNNDINISTSILLKLLMIFQVGISQLLNYLVANRCYIPILLKLLVIVSIG